MEEVKSSTVFIWSIPPAHRLSFSSRLLAIKSIRGQQRALCQNCSNNCNLNEYGFKKTLTTHSQLFCNLGLTFSCHISLFVFPFASDRQEPVIYHSLSLCLQTHRELDGIADSERRRYGALHWTTEAVSVDYLGGGAMIETLHCISVPLCCRYGNGWWNLYCC